MRKRTRVAAVSAGVAILLIVLLWYFCARRSLKLPSGKGRAVATMGFGHGVILACDGSLWVYIADIGFCVRKDAAGGGAVISPDMMRTMAELGMSIFLSEYRDGDEV